MCAISGSFHPGQLSTLYNRQLDRGSITHSLSAYDYEKHTLKIIKKGEGELLESDFKSLKYNKTTYYIVHSQAPTGLSTVDVNIHPAEETYIYGQTSYLWHNGIIKSNEVERLNNIYSTNITWDTKLLLHILIKKEDLSEIDGQFACLFVDPDSRLHIFRNDLAPLFIDGEFNISSTKFENSHEVPSCTMWWLDFPRFSLVPVIRFNTKVHPYFFPED